MAEFIVFDTETRTDLYQNLAFGYYEVYDGGRRDLYGLFFDPKIVTPKEKEILDKHFRKAFEAMGASEEPERLIKRMQKYWRKFENYELQEPTLKRSASIKNLVIKMKRM